MILVTGATGTNGRLVVDALLRAGVGVRAMVQSPAKSAGFVEAGAESAVADFDKPATLTGMPDAFISSRGRRRSPLLKWPRRSHALLGVRCAMWISPTNS